MKRFLVIALLWLGSVFPAFAGLFKATEFTLNNGMQVVVVENHKAPLIKHMVWYKVGAVDEIRGKGGVAHLLEHLMFRGTKLVKGKEFNQKLDELGAEHNAFTSFDMTVYHQLADISKLEALMALEADRMHNLAFNQKAFDAEQKIVYQERQQVVENNPASAFNERFNLLLLGNSPYGQPITGQNDEIMALTYDDARDFYEQYYAPNNAILVLSGDIEPQLAHELAEKYYGKLPSAAIDREEPKEVKDMFKTTLEMSLPNIQAPKMVQKFLLPNYKKLTGTYFDYLVLAEYLGGGETSALYQDLVFEQEVALSVDVNYHYLTRGNSVFSISLRPNSEESFNRVWYVQILDDAVTQAMNNLTEKELEKVKRKMTADLVYINDNPEDVAYWIGYALAIGFKLEDVEGFIDGIKNVTLEGVQEAYRQVKSAAQVEGILLPEEEQGEKQ